MVIVGGLAVIGHIFPIYLKFKGGKGVATTIAVLLAINPLIGLVNALAWLLIFVISKVSALSSIFSIAIATVFAIFSGVEQYQIILYAFYRAYNLREI